MSHDAGSEHADLATSIATALRPVLGEVVVHELAPLTGGASRETWSFDAVDADATVHQLVLRRDPLTRPTAPGAMSLEAQVMGAASAQGMPVPEVLVVDDDAGSWGSAGLVMRRIEGETLARRILRDERFGAARRQLAEQCGRALAALHTIDPDTIDGLEWRDPIEGLREVLDELGDTVPTFEVAMRWLEQRRPDPVGRGVVHGDFRLGNLMVDEQGLRSVLDWELVHEGEPAEDLAWLCVKAWRFGAGPPVAGVGTREQLLDGYAHAGGAVVPEDVLRWWEVYGTLRWGVICMKQYGVHHRGELRSVELAAIGRRVPETEWDLLCLIDPEAASSARSADLDAQAEGPGGEDAADDGATLADDLHGPPTSLELVQAVREFLTEQVMPSTDGLVSFHTRVAANVLATVERELVVGAAQQVARHATLDGLGLGSEHALADAVREGTFDGRAAQLVEVLATGVVARLSVANPRHLALPI
ncbi:hypothetical protein BH10ACT3_BH10ACT3_09610 [soil metagenome]